MKKFKRFQASLKIGYQRILLYFLECHFSISKQFSKKVKKNYKHREYFTLILTLESSLFLMRINHGTSVHRIFTGRYWFVIALSVDPRVLNRICRAHTRASHVRKPTFSSAYANRTFGFEYVQLVRYSLQNYARREKRTRFAISVEPSSRKQIATDSRARARQSVSQSEFR